MPSIFNTHFSNSFITIKPTNLKIFVSLSINIFTYFILENITYIINLINI